MSTKFKSKENLGNSQLSDLYDEACSDLGLDKPAAMGVIILPDATSANVYQVHVKPPEDAAADEIARATLQAIGYALLWLSDAERRVSFPDPQDLRGDRVVASVDAVTAQEIQRLFTAA